MEYIQYDSWDLEKAEEACYSIARLVDIVKEIPLAEDDRDGLYEEIHVALYALTKIIAREYGAADQAWQPEAAREIIKLGAIGFKVFLSKMREFSEAPGHLVLQEITPGLVINPRTMQVRYPQKRGE